MKWFRNFISLDILCLVLFVNTCVKMIEDLVKSVAELQKKVDVLELNHVHSCAVLYKKGVRADGVYTINLDDGFGAFKVRCDMTTSGGGWTVFQRRLDGSVDFYRGWNDYAKGFGDFNGEFWLGLDKIHRLTKIGQNVLRVDVEYFENKTRYAQYSTFAVANDIEKYKLTVAGYSGYSGNAANALSFNNGMKFSTKDVDNDVKTTTNCAVFYKGAWWYRSCGFSNLNGQYKRGSYSIYPVKAYWHFLQIRNYSLKKTEMKIRPRSF